MSTYIVAFANGPFEYAESEYISPLSGRTVPLRLYSEFDHLTVVVYWTNIRTSYYRPGRSSRGTYILFYFQSKILIQLGFCSSALTSELAP